VLFDLLEVWKQDALSFETFDDPRVVLSSYIRAKMQRSRTRPYGSKVWANEIIHGAPTLGEALDESLYDWAKMKEAKIRQWVEDKRILPVEPASLLYMIWASTQHYADFDHQVKILNDHQPLSDMQFERAIQTVTGVILRGIGLEP
jgi:TetR/AcrR family transcriptional regulator